MPFMKADTDRNIAVDIVFCIDATSSANDPIAAGCSVLDIAKSKITNIYTDFSAARERKRKSAIQEMRVRLVIFRDYIANGERTMMVTDFFQLTQQAAEFEACINSIHVDGGGNISEDALEALAYAIKSNWTTKGIFKRHIIMLWTDADTHALGYGSRSRFYLKGMPSDLGELSDLLDGMDCRSKRLVLFAPCDGNWKHISDNWDLTIHIPTGTNNALSSDTYEMVVNILV